MGCVPTDSSQLGGVGEKSLMLYGVVSYMKHSILNPDTKKREWTQEAVHSYRKSTPFGKYLLIVEGLLEAGCKCLNHQFSNISPLEQVSTYDLGGELVIVLYLIGISGELQVCFKVGEPNHLEDLTVELLDNLSPNFLWQSVRGVWENRASKSIDFK